MEHGPVAILQNCFLYNKFAKHYNLDLDINISQLSKSLSILVGMLNGAFIRSLMV